MHLNPFVAPFYVGQKVVAVRAVPGSSYKNGTVYTIKTCHYSYCENGNRHFWYVGVVELNTDWNTPTIFEPIGEEFQYIELSEVLEIETKLISVN